MIGPSLVAFAGALAGVVGLAEVAEAWPADRADRARPWRAAIDAFARAGREGRDPGAAERRRLLALGSLVAFAVAWLAVGVVAAVIAAIGAPVAAGRILRKRRDRYRRAVDAGAAEIAVALADALSGGHSLRGALISAAGSLTGPPGNELRLVAAELELGAPTDVALDGMRGRIALPAVDTIVAGAQMQRKAGGDLAQLLRTAARSFEDEARLLGEVRAATAQARFTGLVVVLLPLGGAGLAELASPGFAGRLVASPLTGAPVGMALAMQIGAAFAIQRLARIRA